MRAPAGGEVQVRSLASAISHGTEMLVYRGQVSAELPLDLPTLQGSFGFPIKYGYALVGHVVEAGPGVSAPAVGELVFVHHPHQSIVTVPVSLAVPLPALSTAEAGVFFANVETALNVMLDAQPRIGETAVVLGQGVVGLLLTQLLRRAGVATIIVADGYDLRRRIATSLGADAGLEPAALVEHVMDATRGCGADVVFEVSGNPDALASAINCAAAGSDVVVCSWYGTKLVPAPLGGAFHRKRLRLVSSQVGAVNASLGPRWDVERRRRVAADLLPKLRLDELITHRFHISAASDAYELVSSDPGETLQVLLTYGDR